MLDVHTLYYEAAALAYPTAQQILARYPTVNRIEVPSHWNIPELNGRSDRAIDWIETKQTTLVLGVKKGLKIVPYERSADFIAPSQANGCSMACAYCYVGRRKGFANPITVFVNVEQVIDVLHKHIRKRGFKFEATAPDPSLWTYELGTNSDSGFDAEVSDNLKQLIAFFRTTPNAKATFATKYVNRALLDYDPQGRTRIRFSLMPPRMARLLDVRTSPIAERIAAINDFHAAGYEVNINFAPVIVYDGWLTDYIALFEQIDDTINAAVKAQLSSEIVFLTHNAALHEVNLQWHPQAETVLWRPELQETKLSGKDGSGGENLRYKMSIKRGMVADLVDALAQTMPYCKVRYAF